MSPAEIWNAYVDRLPWQPGQLDQSSYFAFLRAGSLGVDQETALVVVVERITLAGGRLRARKTEGQLQRAYRHAGSSPKGDIAHNAYCHRNPWPAPDPDLIASIAASGPGLADLAESSPIRFDDDQPHTEEIIDALFPGDPLLCCGATSYRFATKTREHWRGELAQWQFIVPSPMTALFGYTLDGKLSAHSLGNTGPRRFIVVEFDQGPPDDQAALIDYLAHRGPLVLAVHSGGRSLHAWFPCAGVNMDTLQRFMKCAVRLGADIATWRNRSQFVRMPDGLRENGNRQTVHYFNPEVLP